VKWIVAAILVVMGIGLIAAGSHGNASELFDSITGTSTDANPSSGSSSSGGSTSAGGLGAAGSPLGPLLASNLLNNNPAYPGLSSIAGTGVSQAA
jgi:hypothetical protein